MIMQSTQQDSISMAWVAREGDGMLHIGFNGRIRNHKCGSKNNDKQHQIF